MILWGGGGGVKTQTPKHTYNKKLNPIQTPKNVKPTQKLKKKKKRKGIKNIHIELEQSCRPGSARADELLPSSGSASWPAV